MGDGFDVEAPRGDDFAGMLAALEGRLDRHTIARTVGVQESELDLIAVGHAPNAEVGGRLRTLYELAQRTEGDLDHPDALLHAAHAATLEGRLLVPFHLVPGLTKYFIIAFVLAAGLVGVFLFVLRA